MDNKRNRNLKQISFIYLLSYILYKLFRKKKKESIINIYIYCLN